MNQKAKAIPSAVSRRLHAHSVALFVEDRLGYLPLPMRTEEVQEFMRRLVRDAVRWMARDFVKGAERGIEQMAAMLEDPEYFVTLKERRRRVAESRAAYHEQQERERLERRLAPTALEIERERTSLERDIASTEKCLLQWRERLRYLNGLPNQPKHVRITDFKNQHEE
jgi:hypothetical protein